MINKHMLAAVAGCILLASLSACGTRAEAPTLAAAWNFDEGTAVTASDSSGSGDTATLKGGAGWATGLVGPHALNLNGKAGGDAEAPKAAVNTSRSYTVMAWVKLNHIKGFQTFVSIDGAQVSGFFLQLRDDTGAFAFASLPTDAPGAGIVAGASAPPDAGVWYHLAGVHNAKAQTLALYVNGVLQQTTSFTTPWQANGPTAIGRGRYAATPIDWADGTIDDVRLYQTALSPVEILAAAKASAPAIAALAASSSPQAASLTINAAQAGSHVSPMLYGLMTEEINYSYDGGLYAELIHNRSFQDDPAVPAHWSVVQDGGGVGAIALDSGQPVSVALPVSLKLSISAVKGQQRVGAANDGYWGIPVKPDTVYHASFYAKAADGFAGPLAVDIESNDGATVFARGQVVKFSSGWQRYTVTLKTGRVAASTTNRFVLSASSPGTVYLSLVSLFPPTFNDRPNGNRIDLMQKLGAMNPAFLRMPGGNYLEGDTIATRFDWKKTLGPLIGRPGHLGPWSYRSSDGMGLLEFLEWCEDLHMQPVLAVYAGYSLKGEHIAPGPALTPFVQDALDEIEYVTGDVSTKWGAVRAANGHPKPFPLSYVEIGNEDFFDRSGSYSGRYAQFFDAIKAKYPTLQLIATTKVQTRKPDVIDEHYYLTAKTFEGDVHHYDNYDRSGPKIFVGEWASQDIATPWRDADKKGPTPTLNSALGDAAWMTGMERNSDIVVLESYAPLLVNVNPGGRQWAVNLIGYDALNSYGSPSYYAQVMFSRYHGDVVVPAVLTGEGRTLSDSVTRDSKTGMVTIKVVNAGAAARSVQITLTGAGAIAPTGTAITLSGTSLQDTNSLSAPEKIVPVTKPISGLGSSFTYSFAPYSITILRVQGR